MKLKLKNIGLLDHAELELGALTVICGENNSGKTYINYALYGFLRLWRQILTAELMGILEPLWKKGNRFELDLEALIEKYDLLPRICREYAEQLPAVFAAQAERFKDSEFELILEHKPNLREKPFERSIRLEKSGPVSITLNIMVGSPNLEVVLAETVSISRYAGLQIIADAVAVILFGSFLPNTFIASAERTGAAIFRKELDFARSKLLDAIARGEASELNNPFHLMRVTEAAYAYPVRDNVDFVRSLDNLGKQPPGPLLSQHPDLLEDFEDIIGGSYKVIPNEGVYFSPKGTKQPRLNLSESSSAVRALLDIGFFLRHNIEAGDMLMIDEPELNLHPKNQRKLARLLVRLVNAGVRVFITTHSDYIVKEFNTLIMLNRDTANARAVQKQFKYRDDERLNLNDVRLYMTEELPRAKGKRSKGYTVKRAAIDAIQGIEVQTFDKTIDEMNRIQEELLYGEDA